jgi:hypothetical protein
MELFWELDSKAIISHFLDLTMTKATKYHKKKFSFAKW